MTIETVCIFGSRDLPEYYKPLVARIVNQLDPDTVVVSGMARGVDIWAKELAEKRGLEVLKYPALWKGESGKEPYNPRAGFERNLEMVKVSNRGIAFRYNNSSGTTDTVNKFIAAGKEVEIYDFTTGLKNKSNS